MIFRRAALRLTLAYTVIQLALFAVFAIGIYSFVTGTFDFDAAESDGAGAAVGAEQGFALLQVALLVFYAGLMIVVPVSSYIMARVALTPIRESFERQQQFVDGASHEMRSPLAVIQGELELALSRSRTVGEYRSAMATSLDAVAGLTRLTDDLLTMSRLGREELEATFEVVDLSAVVRLVVAAANGRAGVEAQVTPEVTTTTACVRGSEMLLIRAVGNLVDNAITHGASPNGVSVTTDVENDEVVVVVTDTGPGMSPERIAKSFERFWRADESRSTPGHGLGLPLVRQIAEAHGGSVSLHSQVGRGTTATLRIRGLRS